ncbi:small nucleolar ribonucleoprotein-like protein complex subunit [Melanomma pulvis-pyrius CBS 109.77]|uniref:Small nucleolar ribonucleoprotein-like protein complex subunit n=1 Tax=Melanomma pulvis-pyrius CBS 109.77 TaxID=1314802 RepID=A0A6A6X4E1_9PLEO|nr:small nucleolar ribonucleoprotein-like protein complex subunit [Melanomma pulvis-pyrius CBS 109.77]
MDIHRSRFVPYPSSAINALAFSHTQSGEDNEDPECLRLAVGRSNGNIEIWNPVNGAWLQERIFYGGKDRSVEGLAWTQELDEKDEQGKTVPGRLRLFSIGYSSSITEWDLATGLPARHSNGNHSEVWSFAAQPKRKTSVKGSTSVDSDAQQSLVAGCADGTLVLLSTADNELRFDKFLSRSSTKKARVLSVTYKDRNVVLAGFADSMIRVFDTRNGSVLRNISLGSGPPGGPKEILVWKVKCLSNGDFVSGDSTGDIRIYNGKNYSQTQRITGHEADVLDLAVSRDGSMIFSGGMDRRTCFYTCNKKGGATRGNREEKWRKVSHKRYHDHDVKAMATYEGNKLSVVVSGGIDTQPVVAPLRQFGKELSRSLPALPHAPPLLSAPDARLLISWWNCELRIWRVKTQQDGTEKPKVVARLALQGDENITSASITRDGALLAVSTASEVKLFQLTEPKPAAGSSLRIRKLELPSTTGARLVRLVANGKWLAIITATDDVYLARIIVSDDTTDRPRALHPLVHLHRLPRDNTQRDSLNGPWGHYNRSITHAEFSDDGAVFATADLAGYIDTWVVEGHEDSTAPEVDIDQSSSSPVGDDEADDDEEIPTERMSFLGQRWIRNPSGHLLPRLDSAPLLLSFQPGLEGSTPLEPNGNPAVHPTRQNPHPRSHDIPSTEHTLLLVSAEHQLYHFEVLAGRLSEWSRRNPKSSYPSQFRRLDNPTKGCTWDVTEKHQRVWLYGEKWLFMFDLAHDLPFPGSVEASNLAIGVEDQGMAVSKKRKRASIKELSRKSNSGAGGAVPENENLVTKLRKFNSGPSDESVKATWIDLNNARGAAESDEDFDDKQQALATIRRSAGQDGVSFASNRLANGDSLSDEKDAGAGDQSEDVMAQRKSGPEPWWHTFKYRPILGMVSIGGNGLPLEVVLVERPSWDLDLGPRFVGSHE